MTKLPEPNFIERDVEKITQEWISLYEKRTGKTLHPAQIERILIDIGVYRENLLRIKIQEIAKSNLLTYAPMEVLEHLAELVGVQKLKAKYSKTVIKFELSEELTSDILIPKNTEVETSDGKYIFSTDKDVILKANNLSVCVDATCTTIGSITNNYAIGEINNLLTPFSTDFIKIENTEVSTGGADDESADSLRERIRLAPESFSNAGSVGAYKFHTLSVHQDIIDVEVLSSNSGIVDIYPLTKDGNPTETIIKSIFNYLSSDKVRPLTDNVIVHQPEQIDFDIVANLTLYLDADLNTVITMVNNKLKEYKKEISSKLGKDIVPSQIITLLNSIYGVYNVELISPQYKTLEKNQWAKLNNIDIHIGGRADD